MSMHGTRRSPRRGARSVGRPPLLRLSAAGLLGVAAALLVSCGSSGKGLIPSANAGPLQKDFEEVNSAAQNANGNCTATDTAIAKTEQDFNALPPSVDPRLTGRLSEGITHLGKRARDLCAQPLSPTVSTGTTTTSTTTTTTTPTSTETTPTNTTTTPTSTETTPTSTATTPTAPGGGTVAPGSEPPAGGGVGEAGGTPGNGSGGGK